MQIAALVLVGIVLYVYGIGVFRRILLPYRDNWRLCSRCGYEYQKYYCRKCPIHGDKLGFKMESMSIAPETWPISIPIIFLVWIVKPALKGLREGFRSVLKAGEKFPYPK